MTLHLPEHIAMWISIAGALVTIGVTIWTEWYWRKAAREIRKSLGIPEPTKGARR